MDAPMPKLLLLDDAVNLVAALGHLMDGSERESLLAETAKGVAHLIARHNQARRHAGLDALEALTPEMLTARARVVHPSTDRAVRCVVMARQYLFADEVTDFADEYVIEVLLSWAQMFLATVDFLAIEPPATDEARPPPVPARPERAPMGVTLH
jgi:hypothetical protein